MTTSVDAVVRCPSCLRDLPESWKGRCFLCEDRAKEREYRLCEHAQRCAWHFGGDCTCGASNATQPSMGLLGAMEDRHECCENGD